MKEQLRALYELQKIDLQLAAAKNSLAGLDDGAALRKQLSDVEKYLATASETLRKSEAELRDNELNLKSIESKKKNFEDKLYKGQVTNPKELSSMEKEIEMLGKSRTKLDEQILELYELVESQQANVKKAETVLGQLKDRVAKQAAQFEAKSNELNSRIEQLTAERRKALTPITDRSLLQRYEAARSRYKDSGLAVVEDGKCGECHVGLTGFSVRKLKEGTDYQTCESCGRILYLLETEKEHE